MGVPIKNKMADLRVRGSFKKSLLQGLYKRVIHHLKACEEYNAAMGRREVQEHPGGRTD